MRTLPPLTEEELKVLGPRYAEKPHPHEPPNIDSLPPGVTHDHDHSNLECPACSYIEKLLQTNH